MGQVHRGSATTTAAIRRAIQQRQASLRQLSKRCGSNPKTVAKWKKRSSIEDLRTAPSEHRLTKPRHPWTTGQVERMNRTIKDATVTRFHYGSHKQLRMHLADFLD